MVEWRVVQPDAIDEITNLVYDILIGARASRVATIYARLFVARPPLQRRDLGSAVEYIEWARFRGVKSEDGYPRQRGRV